MAAATPAQVAYLLKKYYHGQRVENLVLKDRPLLDKIQKDTTFQGEDEPFPVYTSPGTGVAGSFATAQANANNGKGYKFRLTNGRLYGVVPLDDEALERSRSNLGAFTKLKAQEMEAMFNYMGDTISGQLFGEGGGSLGTISSDPTNTASQTITLTNPGDINAIEVGQILVASANDGSDPNHALRANSVTVTSVDRNAGSFVAAQSDDVSTWSSGDHLFLQDTFGGASAANNTIPIKGLRSWFPLTVTSALFFQVNRTEDSRLTGTLHVGADAVGSALFRIQKGAQKANSLFRARPRLGVVSPEKFLEISVELQNTGPNRDFSTKVSTGHAGYRGLEIASSYGDITLMGDPECRSEDGWLLNEQYMWIKSMRELVHPMDADGQEMLRSANSATYEIRYVSYAQLAISRPSEFARLAL